MGWRLIVLGVLAILLGAISGFCLWQSTDLFIAGQQIYTQAGSNGPSQKLIVAASRQFQTAAALQQLIHPLAVGSILSALSVLVLLARRWQLKETVGRPDPA